jgi:RING finger protein 113A
MTESSQAVEAEAAPTAPVVSFKKRRVKENARKRPAPEPEPASPRSDDDSDFSSTDDESRQGPRVKRRQKHAGIVTAASTSNGNARTNADTVSKTSSDAKPKVPLPTENDATKARNWYDEDSTKTKVGPTRATAANVRMTTFTDYAPDVCKDYKKTGFCGFGDNCVFLHDRSDYKQGWELDRDWENVTKGNKNLGGTVMASANRNKSGAGNEEDEDEDAMLQNIPFACIICEQSYKSPVMTRCGHYFCESCALKRYRKDPSCAACGAATNGVFNSASRLNKLLDKRKERAAKKRQAAIEAGEDVSDEEEDA